MIDGGVFANNPAMCGWVEMVKLRGRPQDILVVSLGTGEVKTGISFAKARLWGLVGWVRPLIGIFMDGVAATVEHQLEHLLTPHNGEPRYFCFQTKLPPGMGSMDDTSPGHIAKLKEQAQLIVEHHTTELDDLCLLLNDPRPLPRDDPAQTTAPTTNM